MISIALFLTLASCAHTPQPQSAEQAAEEMEAFEEDPLEGYNRVMFAINRGIDTVVLHPVSQLYRFVVPEYGRERVSNVLDNLNSPIYFANSLLQGDPQNAGRVFWRFVINSTAGLGGMHDVAKEGGVNARDTDFGQTLALHGVGSGPYTVLPIIGPSSSRDMVGRIADAGMDPFNYYDREIPIWRGIVTVIDRRVANDKLLDDIYNRSIDPYATMRSSYLQRRQAEIRKAAQSMAANNKSVFAK